MSASTTTGSTTTRTPLVITSFPLIPLTTTFTPPGPNCGGIYTPSYPPVFIIDNEPSCLPPKFSTSDSSFFYSPGIACPSGYWTACHDTTGAASITTVTCCPTYGDISLSCVPSPLSLSEVWSTLFCTWGAPVSPGTVVTLTKSADGGRTSTVTNIVSSPGGINAYGVRMVYEASDLVSASSSAASTASSGSSSGTGQTSQTAGPTGASSGADSGTGSDSGSGLSTGATVAIGVVVPLVVIGAALLGLALWWRKRKRQQQAGPPPTAPPTAPSDAPAYDYAAMPPAGGYYPGAKQTTDHYYYGNSPQAHEVPGEWTPSEMPSTLQAAELPATSPTHHQK